MLLLFWERENSNFFFLLLHALCCPFPLAFLSKGEKSNNPGILLIAIQHKTFSPLFSADQFAFTKHTHFQVCNVEVEYMIPRKKEVHGL